MEKRKRIILAGVIPVTLAVISAVGCFVWMRDRNVVRDLHFQCSYDLDVELEPSENSLVYTEKVSVGNEGRDSASKLYFRLYANKDLEKEDQVKIISAVDGNGEPVRVRRLENGELFRVDLNEPLESGETAEITFQCENAIPLMRMNYGVARDGEIQLASFHLQLAVYDEKGWDMAPSCEKGDGRYSQVSDYVLKITAPREYQVVCTGTETGREDTLLKDTLLKDTLLKERDRCVYYFEADRRREIVIAAFTDYRSMERTVGNMTVEGYFNTSKVSEKAAREAFEAAVFAVDYYSRIFVEYPCETLVFTNAGWSVSAPANMEYSGHITVDMGEDVDVSTVYHEVAHQWFYYLVGNNENEEAWLDESFASLCTYLCLEEAGDKKNADIWWDFCREIAGRHPGEKLNVSSDEMGTSYMDMCYFRGTHFLKEMMDTMGREPFFEAVSEYCSKYAYKNASTWDLLHILQAHTEKDLSALIEEYVEEYAE